MAMGRDPRTGQIRETGPNEAVDPRTGDIFALSSSGCNNGGNPEVLPIKGYGPFKPIRAIESGEENILDAEGKPFDPPKKRTLYQYQFQADGDITEWQLMKSCHWLLALIAGFGAVMGGSGIAGGGLGAVGFGGVDIGGSFEYKIVNPGGEIIFWSRVNLCLNIIMLLTLYTVTFAPDRSVDWRSRRFHTSPGEVSPGVGKPDYPVLLPVVDNSGRPNGKIKIAHHGMPSGATKLFVERTLAFDDPSIELPPTLNFEQIDDTPMGDNGNGIFIRDDLTSKLGTNYFYRIKAMNDDNLASHGDAFSIRAYNKDSCRTIIETFVIDGKPTVSHPDINISGAERITYDEYAAVNIVYPKNREETFLTCPPQIFGSGVGSIPLDFNWYGPIYKTNIPNGSILRIVMDGISFGSFTQRGRAAEWQFSAKTISILWGVITDISGRILSTSPEGTGVAVINAENVNSKDPIQTNRARIVFDKGNSAFILKQSNGTILVFVTEDTVTKMYTSTNNGSTFTAVTQLNGDDYTIPIGNGKIIDVTMDKDKIIYLLYTHGTALYVTTSMNDYDNPALVAQSESPMCRFDQGGNEFGGITMSIIGPTTRYVTTDGGVVWTPRVLLPVK
jgi:hypothetical protein